MIDRRCQKAAEIDLIRSAAAGMDGFLHDPGLSAGSFHLFLPGWKFQDYRPGDLIFYRVQIIDPGNIDNRIHVVIFKLLIHIAVMILTYIAHSHFLDFIVKHCPCLLDQFIPVLYRYIAVVDRMFLLPQLIDLAAKAGAYHIVISALYQPLHLLQPKPHLLVIF